MEISFVLCHRDLMSQYECSSVTRYTNIIWNYGYAIIVVRWLLGSYITTFIIFELMESSVLRLF